MGDDEVSPARARLARLGREGRQQPHPGRPDKAAVARWLRYVGPVVRLFFRPEVHGTNNLPAEGPYLLVANHSGLGNPDIGCLIVSFLGRTDIRSPAAMVHPISFNSSPAGLWMLRLGAIPSTYEAAHAALSAGVPVLVFPGGDIDATRPIWRANRVEFGGRKGFLKIARATRVPVVPMGIHGTHYAAPIVLRSRALATLLVFPRLLGVKLFPLTLLAVLGALGLLAMAPRLGWVVSIVLAFLWIVLPLSQAPWVPWKVHIRIGRPIAPEALFPNDDDDAQLDGALERVRSAVEDLVNARGPASR